MTPKRREAIMTSLKAGNVIRRYWNGAESNGYLSHKLEGIRNLRQAEAKELEHERIVILDNKGANHWGVYRLRTADDDKAELQQRADAEAVQCKKDAAEAQRVELSNLFGGIDGNRGVNVTSAAYGDREFRADKFDVTFHGLTEVEVRELSQQFTEVKP